MKINKQMPLAILVGPTACGKTATSIEVAKRLNAEIVSADSVQIYEKIDIGSAKPSKEELAAIPHHLIGVIPLDYLDFSAANYQTLANDMVTEIANQKKQTLVVGGTGFYIRSLTDNLDFSETNRDDAFRLYWQMREEEAAGSAYLELQKIDSVRAQQLHPNDKNRVIRALEVYHLTGRPMSEQKQDSIESNDHCAMVGLTMPRELLYSRIDARVIQMFDQGLVEEVEGILAEGYDPTVPALQSIGYKETIDYLNGKCSKQEAVEQIQLATRHYAKRQWTWFRRDKRICWFDVTEYSPERLVDSMIDYYQEKLYV